MYYIGETLMLAVFSYAAIYFWGPCPFAGKNGFYPLQNKIIQLLLDIYDTCTFLIDNIGRVIFRR